MTLLPEPTLEGLYGTVLCLACGYLGLGIDHPEWCTWQVLRERPADHALALAEIELGPRAALALFDTSGTGVSHS